MQLLEKWTEYFKWSGDHADHIRNLWPHLERKGLSASLQEGNSLIPLPNPYIVPGGRFNEIYYWDSYFTMLGLRLSDRVVDIKNMIDNFAYLIDQFGFIPNGNRTYFLGRSQPPFFSLMVKLLAEIQGTDTLTVYLPSLLKEYDFWMRHTKAPMAFESDLRVVFLPDALLLNRYFDTQPQPREEMYQHDVDAQRRSGRPASEFYTDVRSACESGWDFSSRWFGDGQHFSSIQASQILPVDLHCLLFHLESLIAEAFGVKNKLDRQMHFQALADRRRSALDTYFWNQEAGFYFDHHFVDRQQCKIISAAGVFPLFFNLASPAQGRAVASLISQKLLAPGGLLTTPHETGQQWDAPNGWAPLQWMAVRGLLNYGHDDLAREIARRWVALNDRVFKRTGKMMEKYNVVNLDLEAGGGEYPGQAGFGWTNGVYLQMKQVLGTY